VKTNSEGFRDDEESLDQPEFLFLGDSFTFGWGVDQGYTCPDVFEELTGVKALNMGVTGFGTIQDVLLLKRFCGIHDTKSTRVVVMAYVNDLTDNVNPTGLWPNIRKNGTQILYVDPLEECYECWFAVPRKPVPRMLSRLSYLTDLIGCAIANFQQDDRRLGVNTDSWGASLGGERLNRFETFEYAVRDLMTFAAGRDLDITFCLIPSFLTYEDPEHKDDLEDMKKILKNIGLPTIDLTQVLDRADYLQRDVHWSTSGHRAAALEISRFLLSAEGDFTGRGGRGKPQESLEGEPRSSVPRSDPRSP